MDALDVDLAELEGAIRCTLLTWIERLWLSAHLTS